MIVRELPKRPASASARPSSARARSAREHVKKVREQVKKDPTLAIAHGSAVPTPDSGEVHAGPGHFRSFATESKFAAQDPLKNGEQYKETAQTLFAMGPKAERNDLSLFRTLDISKLNETRHQWQRIDTFQTPAGHVSGLRFCEDAPADDVDGQADALMSETMRRELREMVRAEVQAGVSLICDDISKAATQTVHYITAELKSELTAQENAFKQQLCRLGNDMDLSSVLQRIDERSIGVDFGQLMEQMQLTKTAVVKSLWECKNAVDVTHIGEQVVAEVRRAMPIIDFTEILQAISEMKSSTGLGLADLSNEVVGVRVQVERIEAPKPISTLQACQAIPGVPVNLDFVLDELRSVLESTRLVLKVLGTHDHREKKHVLGTVRKFAEGSAESREETSMSVVASVRSMDAEVLKAFHAELDAAGGTHRDLLQAFARLWNVHQQMANISVRHGEAMAEMQRVAGFGPKLTDVSTSRT